MKIKTGRVVVTIILVALFLILIVSGAIEINLLRAWEWFVNVAQTIFGKISPKPKDFVLLAIGGVIGYLIRGAVKKS